MQRIITIFIGLHLTLSLSAQNPIIQGIVDEVKLDSLINFVENIAGMKPVKINGVNQIIQSRQHQKVGNELAYKYLKSEFERYGYQIDSFRFNPTGKNLYAIKPGYLYPNRWFMMGAHYDNLPLAIVAPGADDNASGCAATLEAARLIANHQFPYTIVFALWDEEEPGFFGSAAHIPKIGSRNEIMMGYINLDMIGWDGNNDSIVDIHVRPVKHSEVLKDKAVFCNTAYTIGVNLNVVNPGVYYSDNIPFWDGGHSAIAINEHNGVDLNPHWHKTSDKLEHFNLSYFHRVTKLSIATLLEMASDIDYNYQLPEDAYDVVKLFPNPFNDDISIRMDNNETITKVTIVDLFGNKAMERNFDSKSVSIDGTLLRTGTYFALITTSENTYTRKIIKN